MLLQERVTPGDFESHHFRRQLAERLAWAVNDAESANAGPDSRTATLNSA